MNKPGTGWFKPQLSFDGVLIVAYVVGMVWFAANIKFQLDANGKAIRSIGKTQIGVLKALQQIKSDVQLLDYTNRQEIIIPDPPMFDTIHINQNTAWIYPLANPPTKDNN
jgi:hypothetical protein